MKCEYCGAEVPEGSGFCPTCGKPVDDDEVIDVGAVGEQPSHASAGGKHAASHAARKASGGQAQGASGKAGRKAKPDTSIDGAFAEDQQKSSEDGWSEEDYNLDDIPPMPLAQKITLLLVIALVVIGASYIIWYMFVR